MSCRAVSGNSTFDIWNKPTPQANYSYTANYRNCRIPKASHGIWRPLHDSEWVVYANAPFGDPDRVLDFLVRVTHPFALTNHLLKPLKSGLDQCASKYYKP